MQQVYIKLEKLPNDMILQLDSFRTNQVVINLLSNALKFSKAFDTIHVKLRTQTVEESDNIEL